MQHRLLSVGTWKLSESISAATRPSLKLDRRSVLDFKFALEALSLETADKLQYLQVVWRLFGLRGAGHSRFAVSTTDAFGRWLKFIWNCRRLPQCLTNKVVCSCPVSQQLCTAALQRAMKPLALRNDCLAWAGRLLAWQSHGQAAREC